MKILLLSLSLLFSSAFAADEKKLVLTARDNSVINGVTEPVLIEAYRRIGIELEFIRLPGNRSIITANSGLSDGEVNRLKFVLTKYKNLRLVPVPIFFSKLSAFTRNSEAKIDDWSSLKNYRTATPASFKFVVNKLKGYPQFHVTKNSSTSLDLLRDNQVDIAVLNRYEASRLIKLFGYRGILAIEPPLETLPIYHLLHKKNEHLIPLLTDALNEMSRDGTLRKIWADNGVSFD